MALFHDLLRLLLLLTTAPDTGRSWDGIFTSSDPLRPPAQTLIRSADGPLEILI